MVGAAPTGDAPTTSGWSTIMLPTKMLFVLEIWWYTRPELGRHCTCKLRCPTTQRRYAIYRHSAGWKVRHIFFGLPMAIIDYHLCGPDNVIQYGWRNLAIYQGIPSVKSSLMSLSPILSFWDMMGYRQKKSMHESASPLHYQTRWDPQ